VGEPVDPARLLPSAVPDPAHVPVLLDEVLAALSPRAGEVFVDCTAGLGGHAEAVARVLGPSGRVVLNDLDAGNLARAAERVAATGVPVEAVHGPFDELPGELARRGIAADLLLADLGFASNQVDDPNRGLSFKRDGPLDMRLDPTRGESAAELLARIGERELADLIWRYGEERLSRRIAQKLVAAREVTPISTTSRVAEIVRSAYPAAMARKSRIDPATRTFQALRIAVNDELGRLDSLLGSIGSEADTVARGGSRWLRPGARVAIISFHSLEDRPVKRAFVGLAERGVAERLTRKPARAAEDESGANPRARSAKLRAIRVGGGSGGVR
jgi:16S rRNA (cytosine1402-N4)-methyltransferase